MDLKALLALLLAARTRFSAEFLAILEPLAAKIDGDEAASTDELTGFRTALADEGKRILAESTDDESIELVSQMKDAREQVSTELVERAAEEAERQAKADALLAELDDPPVAVEGDENDEAETPAESEGGEADEAEAPPAEDAGGDTAAPVKEEEPVAASGKPKARIANVNARRPKSLIVPPTITKTPVDDIALIASANSGMPAGSVIRGAEGIAKAAQKMFDHQIRRGPHNGPTEFLSMGTIVTEFPDDRTMRPGDGNGHNDRVARNVKDKVEALAASADVEALIASGGICFPLNTDFTIKTYGVRDRPLRDRFMVRTGAPRGGIKTTPPLSIDNDEFPDGTDIWTEANDTTPGSDGNATKSYAVIECPDTPRETLIEAITTRLRFGNFNQRFYPELIEAWWDQIQVLSARETERRRLTNGPGKLIATGGYAKSIIAGDDLLSATRDILAYLDRALAIWTQSRRLGTSPQLNLALPFWYWNMIRTDIARGVPFGTLDETLAVADSTINGFFTSRGINPVALLEGESASQEFSIQQNVGTLQRWPDKTYGYLSQPGDWLALDAGTMDFGLVRDTTLNNTNDAEMFVEVFEAAHFTGLETWRFEFEVCPTGEHAGPNADFAPCAGGS